jgi:hypothetical protein
MADPFDSILGNLNTLINQTFNAPAPSAPSFDQTWANLTTLINQSVPTPSFTAPSVSLPTIPVQTVPTMVVPQISETLPDIQQIQANLQKLTAQAVQDMGGALNAAHVEITPLITGAMALPAVQRPSAQIVPTIDQTSSILTKLVNSAQTILNATKQNLDEATIKAINNETIRSLNLLQSNPTNIDKTLQDIEANLNAIMDTHGIHVDTITKATDAIVSKTTEAAPKLIDLAAQYKTPETINLATTGQVTPSGMVIGKLIDLTSAKPDTIIIGGQKTGVIDLTGFTTPGAKPTTTPQQPEALPGVQRPTSTIRPGGITPEQNIQMVPTTPIPPAPISPGGTGPYLLHVDASNLVPGIVSGDYRFATYGELADGEAKLKGYYLANAPKDAEGHYTGLVGIKETGPGITEAYETTWGQVSYSSGAAVPMILNPDGTYRAAQVVNNKYEDMTGKNYTWMGVDTAQNILSTQAAQEHIQAQAAIASSTKAMVDTVNAINAGNIRVQGEITSIPQTPKQDLLSRGLQWLASLDMDSSDKMIAENLAVKVAPTKPQEIVVKEMGTAIVGQPGFGPIPGVVTESTAQKAESSLVGALKLGVTTIKYELQGSTPEDARALALSNPEDMALTTLGKTTIQNQIADINTKGELASIGNMDKNDATRFFLKFAAPDNIAQLNTPQADKWISLQVIDSTITGNALTTIGKDRIATALDVYTPTEQDVENAGWNNLYRTTRDVATPKFTGLPFVDIPLLIATGGFDDLGSLVWNSARNALETKGIPAAIDALSGLDDLAHFMKAASITVPERSIMAENIGNKLNLFTIPDVALADEAELTTNKGIVYLQAKVNNVPVTIMPDNIKVLSNAGFGQQALEVAARSAQFTSPEEFAGTLIKAAKGMDRGTIVQAIDALPDASTPFTSALGDVTEINLKQTLKDTVLPTIDVAAEKDYTNFLMQQAVFKEGAAPVVAKTPEMLRPSTIGEAAAAITPENEVIFARSKVYYPGDNTLYLEKAGGDVYLPKNLVDRQMILPQDGVINLGGTKAVRDEMGNIVSQEPINLYFKITDKSEMQLGSLTDKDAQRAGFTNWDDMKKYWAGTQPTAEANLNQVVYKFKVVPADDAAIEAAKQAVATEETRMLINEEKANTGQLAQEAQQVAETRTMMEAMGKGATQAEIARAGKLPSTIEDYIGTNLATLQSELKQDQLTALASAIKDEFNVNGIVDVKAIESNLPFLYDNKGQIADLFAGAKNKTIRDAIAQTLADYGANVAKIKKPWVSTIEATLNWNDLNSFVKETDQIPYRLLEVKFKTNPDLFALDLGKIDKLAPDLANMMSKDAAWMSKSGIKFETTITAAEQKVINKYMDYANKKIPFSQITVEDTKAINAIKTKNPDWAAKFNSEFSDAYEKTFKAPASGTLAKALNGDVDATKLVNSDLKSIQRLRVQNEGADAIRSASTESIVSRTDLAPQIKSDLLAAKHDLAITDLATKAGLDAPTANLIKAATDAGKHEMMTAARDDQLWQAAQKFEPDHWKLFNQANLDAEGKIIYDFDSLATTRQLTEAIGKSQIETDLVNGLISKGIVNHTDADKVLLDAIKWRVTTPDAAPMELFDLLTDMKVAPQTPEISMFTVDVANRLGDEEITLIARELIC